MNDDIRVVLKKLPGKIRGFCCLGSDYEPIIFINENLSPYEQRKVYLHEKKHVERGEVWDATFEEY